MSTSFSTRSLAVVGAFLALTACSDLLTLDVEAPGRIEDTDLNTAQAIPGVVVGMSYDLTDAVSSNLEWGNLAGGEIWHGGSYDRGQVPQGVFKTETIDFNGRYNSMQQARWVAEHGLQRIAEVIEPTDFEKSPDVARAYLLGGFANRLLGEMQCRTTIDGGPDLPHTEHFNRADSMFTRAITVGQAAGKTDIVRAAYGGRASIRLSLGQYAQAAVDAAQVPTDFVNKAIFSIANQNNLVYETTYRREYSVWSSMWESVTNDPRVPWIIPVDNKGQILKGQDGSTLFYQQKKWLGEGDDVPLTKGTEARLIQAEVALRSNDYTAAQGFINQARAQYGMAGLTLPTTQAEAWPVLRFERYATNWLEVRRLWDMRRWSVEGAPKADPYATGRDLCFPISDREKRSNRNVAAQWGGCPTCG